jgi:hypothetical protein
MVRILHDMIDVGIEFSDGKVVDAHRGGMGKSEN